MFCDLKRHGLNEPKLVVANGALGAWAALRDVSPRHHLVADVLDGVSLKDGIRVPDGGSHGMTDEKVAAWLTSPLRINPQRLEASPRRARRRVCARRAVAPFPVGAG